MSRGDDNIFYFLNNNIKYLRKKQNIKQVDLAQKLNIHTISLANIESGKRDVSLQKLDEIRKIFNINVNDLIFKDLEAEESNINN